MRAIDYRGLLPELVSSSVFRPSDLGTPTHGMSDIIIDCVQSGLGSSHGSAVIFDLPVWPKLRLM
jgi:hypothetical protein